MRYLIHGMRTIYESQIENNNYSHKNLLAVDYAGEDSGKDAWFAVDGAYKCIAILSYASTGFANTMFFTPCNAAGVPEKVMCADGKSRIVTIALTHDMIVRHKVGEVIPKGSILYVEGTQGAKGGARVTGNHIHCEVAEGLVYKKTYSNGQYRMANALYPSKTFYFLEGYTQIKKSLTGIKNYVQDITVKADKEEEDMLKTIHVDRVGMYLRKAVKGTVVAFIPAGSAMEFAKVKPVANRQSDGYQWFEVELKNSITYKGVTTAAGTTLYCQYDSSCYWVE